MNIKKMILYVIAATLGVALINAWMSDYPPTAVKTTASASQPQASGNHNGSYVPSTFDVASHKATVNAPAGGEAVSSGKLIHVKTDLLDVVLNTQGGNVVSAKLLKYTKSLQDKSPVQLFDASDDHLYVAQSGVTNAGSPDKIHYSVSSSQYTLQPGQDQLKVVMTGHSHGLKITKTYILQRGRYDIQLDTTVDNQSAQTWKGGFYQQLVRRDVPVKKSFHSRSYSGASYHTNDTPYKKLSFKSMSETNLDVTNQGGWVAMQQPYFVSSWVPNQKTMLRYYSHSQGNGEDGKNNVFTIGYVTALDTLPPGHSVTSSAKLYVGPEIAKLLKHLAPGLKLTVDYGWLAPVSVIIFWIMQKIFWVVGNWGWSIVLVTILIKLLFYPLSNKSYKSMARMRELQPKMKAMKEKYGDDKQAMGRATMELYKKEKVNPMGGCMPMVVQIPVFFALYYVLIESVQLRQAPFIFWIHDLAVKDPYYVLPILMGLTMLLQTRLNPPSPDPTQAKMMYLMPVIFTVFFLSFPAGLVLYWLTNSAFSILQQWWVMRTYDAKKEDQKQRYKKRKKK